MKNRSVVLSFLLLVVVASLYRVIPGRPYGFAPQFAMAIFGGAIFRNNKSWAFLLPLLSMFVSDALYEILYHAGITTIQGFYSGQWENYLLFALLTSIGFFIKKIKVVPIFLASLAAPTVYFLLSNFLVWLGGGGLQRPKNLQGLLHCYNDALPFYPNSLYATIVFSTVLFGGFYLLMKEGVFKTRKSLIS